MSPAPGERSGVRWILVWGVLDVVASALIATLVFRNFGAVSQDDTNPPVCSNSAGLVVSCDLTPIVLMLPTFGVALFALIAWQVIRWRSRQP